MIHARQAQKGIENFFHNLIAIITKLAKSGHIADIDDWGRHEMDFALTIDPEAITALSRVDAFGKIIYTSPYNAALIGQDLSSQKHIHESLTTHRPVVSDVFTAVQGYKAVALHVPVFKGNEYQGSIGILINFQSIAMRFLQEIHIGKTGYAWMIDREGTEIYCPVPGHTGNSVFDNCKDFPDILSMAKKMTQGRQGTAVYLFDRIKDQHRKTVKKHAVYLPVTIGDNFWSIVIASSEDELLASLVSFKNKILAVVGLLLLLSFIFSYFGTKAWGIVREETARRKAEAALRESEEIFNQLLEQSPIYIFFKDEKIRSIRLSKNYEKMLGKPIEALLGKTMDDLFPSELAKSMIADDMRILNEGKVIHTEEELNGRIYTTTKFPIHLDGKPRYLAGYTIDITDRKQMEEEKRFLEERLQRAEKMEALGTLAGGVAHDLNNVLGVVVGYAELLLDDVAAPSPLASGLQAILGGGQKAAAMVEDLLTLARRGVPGRSILNLNRIIVTNLNSPEFERLSAAHSGVRIKTSLDPDLLNIAGSAVHLAKTLFNLASNAAEAMPDGGTLTIHTTNRYLDKPIQGYDEIREGDYVVLSVSDTGEGIQPADLKRIFEPFYTKKVMGRSGTGLGLAVVWGTVKDHHGYINVHSEAGKGSTFTLYFPVTREELTVEAASIPIVEYMGNGESILVVDDVKEQRDLATTILKKLNYSVESVSSGEDALVYMKTHSVDLLVLDMIMDPGMDGLDTYKSALSIHPKQKAIIVSGFSETERVNAALALGAGVYVKKPYIIEKLGLAIRKELDRASFREPGQKK
jgi:PAS domain S-box-containing protein